MVIEAQAIYDMVRISSPKQTGAGLPDFPGLWLKKRCSGRGKGLTEILEKSDNHM